MELTKTINGINIKALEIKLKTKYNLKISEMPKNEFNMAKTEDIDTFNTLFDWAKNNISSCFTVSDTTEMYDIFRKNYDHLAAFYIINNSVSYAVQIYVKYYRFQFKFSIADNTDTQTKANGKKLYGYQALIVFKKKCKEFGINLDDYAVSRAEGLEWKAKISKPLIKGSRLLNFDETYENVHHIDFHNSYPAGLVNTHPEFKPVVEYFYKNRKKDEINKAVLNYTIGCFQSGQQQYKYASLAHDAINDNNMRIIRLANDLHYCGCKVLAFNTDGIWYQGEIYHADGEGSGLGQWENDHTNCTFRMKSAGSYEFIEDGKYHPVVRGKTKLDLEKPRSEWKWGDIYQAGELIKYEFTFDKGITEMEDDDYE